MRGDLPATDTNQDLDLLARAGKPAAKGSDIVDVDSGWPNNYQIPAASVPHLEKVHSNLRLNNLSQIRRQHERSRYELVDMRTVYVCYCGRCSSSLGRLLGEFALYQKSSTTNEKAVVRRVTKVDHRSKPRFKECQKLIGIHTHGRGHPC